MEKQNKSAFQRILAVALTLIMVVGMLPMNVIALEPSDRATVTTIGGGMPVDDGNGNITVTVTEATLDWAAATAEHGEGWWVGVCVTAPESITAEELALSTYTADGGMPESFVSKSGGASYIQLWLPVTEEFLAAGVAETDVYVFDWNGLGDNNQTVTLTVVPSESIVLNPKASDPEPEPETVTLTVSKTGNGTVKVNGSEVVDSVTVLKDTAVPVEVIPAAGYQIASLTVGGVSKTVEGSYSESVTFADGAAIVVTFQAITYSISVPPVAGGTVAVTDAEQNSVTTAHYGDQITVSVTAEPGYRVGVIKVNGAEISNQEVITVTENIAIDVTFVKIYTVTVHYDENGSVKVDGQDVVTGGSITVDEGDDNITVIATPNEGYLVSSVTIDGNAQEIAVDNTYNLPKVKDYTIQVSFVPSSYSIVIEPIENGTVTCEPAGETVNYGDSVTVTVMPYEGYEVVAVTVNDVAVSLDENGQFIISDIKENKTIKATFTLKTYDVIVEDTVNGTVVSDKTTAEHGQDVMIAITPDEGYTVSQVLVNGAERTDLALVDGTDNQFTLTIEATGNLNVEVSFATIDVTDKGLTISGELIWEKTDETAHTFGYKRNGDSSITFATDKDGVRIKLTDGNWLGGCDQKEIIVNETINVEKIELYYQAEGEIVSCWHPVQTQPEGKALTFAVDDNPGGLQLPEANDNGYYCADFEVGFRVRGDETSTSIQSVEYYVIKNATESDPVETQTGTLYTAGGEATLDNLQFTVDAALNNGDNTKIVVKVTDQAGNITTYEKRVNISYVTATIEFSGTPNKTILIDDGGVKGYYNQSRTATITVIENAHRFNPDNVKYFISVFFTGGTPVNREDAYTVGDWVSVGDQHKLTITFHDVEVVNDDGEVTHEGVNYAWEFDKSTAKTYLTYTDAAGRVLKFQVVEGSETPYYFAVDRTPPSASITINKDGDDEMVWKFWQKEWLEFSLYKNADYTITLNGSDKVSGIDLQYFCTDKTDRLSLEQLQDGDPDNGEFEAVSKNPYTIDTEGPRVVYLKVTDYAGNATYVNSDGVILDKEITDDEFKLSHPNMENNQPYGDDGKDKVTVTVTVTNMVSGVKKIEYWIERDKEVNEQGVLYPKPLDNVAEGESDEKGPTYDDLVRSDKWIIEVDKKTYNCSNVEVCVKVSDNAGNVREKTVKPVIDITPPDVTLNPLNSAKTREEDGETVYVYNQSAGENITVKLNASDEGGTGIASVEYWIVTDGVAGEVTTCTTLEEILVNTAEYNSGNVVVHVRVTDKANNPTEEAVKLDIDITPPDAKLTPQNPAKTREENGETVYVYNQSAGENVAVKLDVSDGGDSGIASVEYWIEKDGNAGPSTTCTTLEGIPSEILVNTAVNNSSNVVVHVRVTDNAGNSDIDSVKLDIDMTPPTIEIKLDKDEGSSFNAKYTATITITERGNHLDKDAVESAINIEIRDANYNYIPIDNASDPHYTMVTKCEAGDTPDGDRYIVTIAFAKDGNYKLGMTGITDLAGNENPGISWNGGQTSGQNEDSFGFDNTLPVGTVIWSAGAGKGGSSDKLQEGTDISYYNGNVTVTFDEDETDIAGLDYIQYYLVYGDTKQSWTELDNLKPEVWSEKIPGNNVGAWSLPLTPNQKVTVYVKLVDLGDKVNYISTNGMILDDTPPSVDKLEPEVEPTTRIYTEDVKVNISVTDPIGKAPGGTEGLISGLDDVVVTIRDQDGSGDGVAADVQWTTKNDGIWEGWFMVDSEAFNSNNVEVKAVTTDNAGNQDEKIILLAIDTTKPTIRVTYTDHGAENNGYFNGRRTAIIEVTERNFTPENISITVNDVDAKIGNWTKTGTGDQTVHRAEIPFNEDGTYTLKVVSCKDDAGQAADPVGADVFTIDMTAPVITVNYNNNDVQNDRYFKEPRVATITIKEQNFDENKVTITQTAAQGGVTPNVAWAHNGDTHVATLTYSVDGVYTFDITASDLAGNPSAEAAFNGVAGKDFVIDTTYEDMVTIGGVANGKAYGYGETPIPTVQIGDINLDEYGIKLTGIQKGKTIDLTDQVYALLNAGAQEVNGTFNIFQVVQDLDGIYTLSVYGLDKAGNEDREEVTFTVNRFGSVYVYNDYLMGLIANGGARTPKLTEDLVITEYNAVKLLAGSLVIEITCDGRPLENPIYEATPEINDSVAVGDSGWYQYRYTISKDNFTSDGVYKITVSSKDAAGNAAENNNYEGMSITFRVDSTAPEITSIVGLEETIIDAAEVTVKYTAYDTMGLKSIQVYVDGVLVDEVTDFSADLSNYSGSFTLTEKSAVQHVRIVVEDLSGNATDTDSEYFVSAYEFHKDVTVSTNIFVRWYANKGLFWGSIGGLLAAAGLVIFLVAKKRKKNDAR